MSLVYPGSEEALLVNLAHLEPKRRPVFPLDYDETTEGRKGQKGKQREETSDSNWNGGGTQREKRRHTGRGRTLVDAAQDLSISQVAEDEDLIDDGNVYAKDPDTDESSSPDVVDKTPVLNGREEVEPPGLEGWRISTLVGEDDGQKRILKSPRLMNCAFGMGGRVIVGVGSQSNVWVWNLNSKGS